MEQLLTSWEPVSIPLTITIYFFIRTEHIAQPSLLQPILSPIHLYIKAFILVKLQVQILKTPSTLEWEVEPYAWTKFVMQPFVKTKLPFSSVGRADGPCLVHLENMSAITKQYFFPSHAPTWWPLTTLYLMQRSRGNRHFK